MVALTVDAAQRPRAARAIVTFLAAARAEFGPCPALVGRMVEPLALRASANCFHKWDDGKYFGTDLNSLGEISELKRDFHCLTVLESLLAVGLLTITELQSLNIRDGFVTSLDSVDVLC
jgi:hypothetical protein